MMRLRPSISVRQRLSSSALLVAGGALVLGACGNDQQRPPQQAPDPAGLGAAAGSSGAPETPAGETIDFDPNVIGDALSKLDCAPTDSSQLDIPEGGAQIGSFDNVGSYSAEDVNVMVETVAVSGQDFDSAQRASSDDTPTEPWSASLYARNTGPITQGDALLAEFWMRCEKSLQESGECRTTFAFELGMDPWTKSVEVGATATHEWRRILIPFTAEESYAASAAQASFRLGFADQTVDIAGYRLFNFGSSLKSDDLPETTITYGGMEEDAAWRASATARIEQHRKSKLSISVEDGSGQPLSGAKVSVRLVRHAYQFGTAISSPHLRSTEGTEAGDLYRSKVLELFNAVTPENALKWEPLAGDWGASYDPSLAEYAVDWANDSGLDARGHVLVWPSWRNLPAFMKDLESDPAALRTAVNEHIDQLVTLMKGRLLHWDVLNEPYDNHDLMDILGEDEMIAWFERAEQNDPETPLFINDYAILSGGDGDTQHRDHYESVIELLIDGGAPLDGIGMQGHFGGTLTSPGYVLETLDRFADFDKEIVVTEYDITLEDERIAACYTRDFLTAVFSHDSTTGFFMWGFWDGAHWKENAPVFDTEWNMKLQGAIYRDLVFGEWATNEELESDASGAATVSGFHGKYEVTVTHGGKSKTQAAALEPGGTSVSVVLD